MQNADAVGFEVKHERHGSLLAMQIWNLRKGSPDQSFIYLYDGWNGRGFAVRWCNEIICFPGTLNLTAQSTTVWWVWVVAEPPMPKAKQGCISVQT